MVTGLDSSADLSDNRKDATPEALVAVAKRLVQVFENLAKMRVTQSSGEEGDYPFLMGKRGV